MPARGQQLPSTGCSQDRTEASTGPGGRRSASSRLGPGSSLPCASVSPGRGGRVGGSLGKGPDFSSPQSSLQTWVEAGARPGNSRLSHSPAPAAKGTAKPGRGGSQRLQGAQLPASGALQLCQPRATLTQPLRPSSLLGGRSATAVSSGGTPRAPALGAGAELQACRARGGEGPAAPCNLQPRSKGRHKGKTGRKSARTMPAPCNYTSPSSFGPAWPSVPSPRLPLPWVAPGWGVLGGRCQPTPGACRLGPQRASAQVPLAVTSAGPCSGSPIPRERLHLLPMCPPSHRHPTAPHRRAAKREALPRAAPAGGLIYLLRSDIIKGSRRGWIMRGHASQVGWEGDRTLLVNRAGACCLRNSPLALNLC